MLKRKIVYRNKLPQRVRDEVCLWFVVSVFPELLLGLSSHASRMGRLEEHSLKALPQCDGGECKAGSMARELQEDYGA